MAGSLDPVRAGTAGVSGWPGTLTDRATAEQLYFSLLRKLTALLDPRIRRHRELEQQLRLKLADKYFINLSIFQSLPDIWALDQVFPVVPLSRLHERPDRHAVLEDLTCDSDGRIERFVDLGGVEDTLRVHALRSGEDYLLGIFMSGAYQETLGDMHNLFGDTDSVDVLIAGDQLQLQRARSGDSAAQLLHYVGYDADRCWRRCSSALTTPLCLRHKAMNCWQTIGTACRHRPIPNSNLTIEANCLSGQHRPNIIIFLQRLRVLHYSSAPPAQALM